MILISEVFNLSNGSSIIVGFKKKNHNFNLPHNFLLYVNNHLECIVDVVGVVLGGNNNHNHEKFDEIHLACTGHLDKDKINNSFAILVSADEKN